MTEGFLREAGGNLERLQEFQLALGRSRRQEVVQRRLHRNPENAIPRPKVEKRGTKFLTGLTAWQLFQVKNPFSKYAGLPGGVKMTAERYRALGSPQKRKLKAEAEAISTQPEARRRLLGELSTFRPREDWEREFRSFGILPPLPQTRTNPAPAPTPAPYSTPVPPPVTSPISAPSPGSPDFPDFPEFNPASAPALGFDEFTPIPTATTSLEDHLPADVFPESGMDEDLDEWGIAGGEAPFFEIEGDHGHPENNLVDMDDIEATVEEVCRLVMDIIQGIGRGDFHAVHRLGESNIYQVPFFVSVSFGNHNHNLG